MPRIAARVTPIYYHLPSLVGHEPRVRLEAPVGSVGIRSQLHDAKMWPSGKISIQAPAQAGVAALGAIDVGHREADDLELRLDDDPTGLDPLGDLLAQHYDRVHLTGAARDDDNNQDEGDPGSPDDKE